MTLEEVHQSRIALDKKLSSLSSPLESTVSEEVVIKNVTCYWVRNRNYHQKTSKRTILYLHGGGYIQGSFTTHHPMVSRIAHYTNTQILFVNYRLAPEYVFPAGLDDCLLVYQWLLEQGYNAKNIALVGDSAGAGLALTFLQKLREMSIEYPACSVLISPFIDITGKSPSWERLRDVDQILAKEGLEEVYELYANGLPASHPYLSPVYADLTGFPPILIQIGTHDILLDENVKLAHSAVEAGVEIKLEQWKYMQHVWYAFFPELPECTKGYEHIAEYLGKHLK